jgi:hypothetical protein
VEKIKTWKDVISYMQDNPDSILLLDSVGNSTPRLLLNDELITPRMPWGLELDKMIGRKVFGWREWSQAARKTNSYDRSKWWDPDGSCLVHLNHFSTDIKAAWDLAEQFRLCVVPFGEAGKGYWTAVQPGCILADGHRNAAPTAPHAICLAALFYTNEDSE